MRLSPTPSTPAASFVVRAEASKATYLAAVRARLTRREVQTSLLQDHNLLFGELPAGICCPPARRHLGDDVEHKASRLLSDVLRTPPYPTIPELLLRKLHSLNLSTTVLLTQNHSVSLR